MGKRGQATIFIILGIVLVLIVALYFVGVKTNIIPPLLTPSDASTELNEIEEHIEDCLTDVGSEYVTLIGQQGGYLSPGEDTYRLYNDTFVSYLCWNREGVEPCNNRMLTLNKMDEELTEVISDALETCINVYDISNDVTVEGDWELNVDINLKTVVLDLNYPVTVDKGSDDFASEDEFSVSLDMPLGQLYEVSQDIVNQHASVGVFDQLIYMLSKLGMYTIYKYKPYPDTIYQVKLREDGYVFQFAIQGEENV
ncbi:MAG: hypothetical protein Q8Q35_04745 [Nanoarchaeota archaeon]|nr:hypothetical protein [Nanoarchaeota archaeon]